MGNIVAWALVQKTPGNDKTPSDDKSFVSPYGDRPVSATNPSHYRSHPSGVECIEVIRELPFSAGNAIKYIWRAGQKDSAEQDLDKALWYVRDCIDNKIDCCADDPTMDMFQRWADKETDPDKISAVELILLNRPTRAIDYIENLRYKASKAKPQSPKAKGPRAEPWPRPMPIDQAPVPMPMTWPPTVHDPWPRVTYGNLG